MLYWLYMAFKSHKMFSPTSYQTQSDQHDWLINFDWLIRFMIILFRRQSWSVVFIPNNQHLITQNFIMQHVYMDFAWAADLI